MTTIMLCGGGTGGHIMPLLAVAHELKLLNPDLKIVYVGERRSKFTHLIKDSPDVDGLYLIWAGKFRRYHGESWLRRVIDIKTLALNIRDFGRFTAGLIQSLRLLGKVRPDAVFIKGGFVGVPVGLSAALTKTPYVTHDSDVLPGLANRLIARWAKYHAVGMPAEFYTYPKAKTYFVGTPVPKTFVPVDERLQTSYKQQLKLKPSNQVLLITGGSQGAVRLNRFAQEAVVDLLRSRPELVVFHQAGSHLDELYKNVETDIKDRLIVKEFFSDMHIYSGAADLIVTRAGASTLAEFAVQGKACLVVPNPDLTGGHQLKNADNLVSTGAIEVITEAKLKASPNSLHTAIERLLENLKLRDALSNKIAQLGKRNAAKELAQLVVKAANKSDDTK